MIAETFGTITSNQWFATVLPLLIKHNVLDLVVLWKQPYGSSNPAGPHWQACMRPLVIIFNDL